MSTSQLLVTVFLAALATSAFAKVDEEAAIALAKKSDCFKCHSVETKKEGPAYREVAKKYKGKAEAEDKLFTHVTTAPIVKVDGVEEEHQIVKTRKKDAIENLIRWILSR
ncbi:MAG TPA: c-type cytochrome [Rhodocyclaceae bacterium]